MASIQKSPGVYIEEISTIPPSIAAVETAIPAFIGYTEFRKKNGIAFGKDIPTRIESLLDFEEMFGGPYREEMDVVVEGNVADGVTTISVSPHYGAAGDDHSPYSLYYHVSAYFANGGGKCYIVSVGTYESLLSNASNAGKIDNAAISAGVSACEKVDEITLLTSPEITLLSNAEQLALHDEMLAQCAKLQDRFTLMDVIHSDIDPGADINADMNSFRSNNVGADNLSYGAAYYPLLSSSLNYKTADAMVHVQDNRVGGLGSVRLSQLTPNNAASATGSVWVHDNSKLADTQEFIIGTDTLVFGAAADIAIGLSASATATNLATAISGLADYTATAVGSIVYITAGTAGHTANAVHMTYSEEDEPGLTLSGPYLTGGQSISNLYASATITIGTLANLTAGGNDEIEVDGTPFIADTDFTVEATKSATAINLMEAINDANLDVIATAAADTVTLRSKLFGTDGNLTTLDYTDNGTAGGASISGATLSGGMSNLDLVLYSQIKNELDKVNVNVYPASVMAGIYARVDNDRGVWKAPANVGVRNVSKPAIAITSEKQENLNVDATTGKSINAIRKFTGKGTLVWGARTLAGNDNEWRYVSVRRLYLMVEESIKKATEFVVFEPNDANTWMRVKTMTENFLNNLWRQGALAGAKPEDAYFVNVGLGTTMTSQDILEGRMIVEIGMAAVRPAEFIILKFSHKLAVS